jgi:hypothetical protein
MVQGDVISFRVDLYRDQHATIVTALSLANNVADLPDVGERAVRRWLSLNTTCSTPKIRLQHHQGSQSALGDVLGALPQILSAPWKSPHFESYSPFYESPHSRCIRD